MKHERVKKSLEKSKNVLEEKRKNVERKICIKETHVYNNCYELRSRAINNCYELRSRAINKPREVKILPQKMLQVSTKVKRTNLVRQRKHTREIAGK